MENKKQLSPQERALNFQKLTRPYYQTLPSLQFTEGQTISIQIPKTRFLSRIFLQVDGTFKLAHASKTTFTKSIFDKYNLLRSIRLSINNGFNPYSISGGMLSLYNKVNSYKNNFVASDTVFETELLENVVDTTAHSNRVRYTLEVPLTLNERDTIGMLMAQSEETVITLNIDCGTIANLMTDTDITSSVVAITVTPITETFAIPQTPDAIPDYSIFKLVTETTYPILGNGDVIIKLPTSLTYRKLIMYMESDTIGTAIPYTSINSVQLIFNQADSPYSVNGKFLNYENRKEYQGALPLGSYAIDFSSQGIANFGNARDYIDTEKLTECWIKINFSGLTGSTNNIKVVSEMLAKMQ